MTTIKRKALSRPWPLLVAVAAILATATFLALALYGQSGGAADPPRGPFAPKDVPPPLPVSEFLDGDGRFTAPLWDDRHISEEDKAADPHPNPAWKFFGACVAGRGYEVRADPARQFLQADLNALAARANREHPNAQANFAVARLEKGKRPPGLASAWLDCTDEWLRKTPEDIYKLTGEPNHWYPPQVAPTTTSTP